MGILYEAQALAPSTETSLILVTVVSRAAKESRTRVTTVSYLHKWITLIERSPKTSSKTYLLKKSARTTKITSYSRIMLNK